MKQREDDGYIALYANQFSTYAIGYSPIYVVTFDANGGEGNMTLQPVGGTEALNANVTKADDTTYTYIQPGMDVTVNVTFRATGAADATEAFSDVSPSDWAREAMCWLTMNGVINGMDGALAPAAGASRAQVATMLMRYCESR